MDDEQKRKVAQRIAQVLREEGITDPSEVLTLMQEGVVKSAERVEYGAAPRSNEFDEVPQPFQSMLRMMDDNDDFLVVMRGEVPERVVCVPGVGEFQKVKEPDNRVTHPIDQKIVANREREQKVTVAEKALQAPGSKVHRVKGAYVRSWVVMLARAWGHKLSDLGVQAVKQPAAHPGRVTFT